LSQAPRRQSRRTDLELLESRRLLAGAGFEDHDHAHAPLVESYVPAVSFHRDADGFLTGPAAGKPLDIALNYLRANAASFGLAPLDLESPIITSSYRDTLSGITHIYLMQEFNGLAVTNARMNVSVMPDGSILSVGGGFVPGLGAREADAAAPVPRLDPRQALNAIADDLDVAPQQQAISISNRTSRLDRRQTLVAPDFSIDPITAHLQYVAMPDGSTRLGWRMILDMPGGEHWYELTVDSTSGQVLHAGDYISHATYNIVAAPSAHPHDPSPGSSPNRTSIINPWDTIASPHGWHDTNGQTGNDTTETRGNNVVAQEDVNDNNGVGLRAQGGPSLLFDFPLDLGLEPIGYQNASLTNLFYWNNLIHDVSYRYGFTEVAGNFQLNNYGRGGAQNDEVQADGQDGGGINNANFGTPADGARPRMQMYLWDATDPMRDGSFDNRIIVHEYGHGISTRLTGGPQNVLSLTARQSGGMGEGWSDFLSLLFTLRPTDGPNGAYGVGTYALGEPNTGNGVRRFPYSYDMSIDPLTFDDYNNSSTSGSVHRTGELWCAALFDVTWNLIAKHGFSPNFAAGYDPGTGNNKGNQLAMRLVLDAMKLQPSNPTFIQARDAFLAADVALTGGANQAEIWAGFARRGLGINASTSGSGSSSIVTDYTVPIADPIVTGHVPIGTSLAPVTFVEITFNQAMDQASFSIVDDVASFLAPGGADIKHTITTFSWTAPEKLRIDFQPTVLRGTYALTIGPNILAQDDGRPMNNDGDATSGEIPDDQYTATFAFDTTLGPDAFGYKASATTFQNLNLMFGQAGVIVLVNGLDDTATALPLPGGNTFNFYGTSYDTIFASPNGLITFGTGTNAHQNTDMTASPTQASIAVAWDDWRTDLNAGPDSAVLWHLADDRLIIEWSDVPNRVPADGTVTFQAILQLNTGTSAGRIVLNYPDLATTNPSHHNGAGASVGIKDTGAQPPAPGARRLLVAQDDAAHPWLGSNKAILLSVEPPPADPPAVITSAFEYLTSHAVRVSFSENVAASIDAADLVLHNDTTNTTIPSAAQSVSYDAGTNTATFIFPGLPDDLLSDGNYSATLVASGVSDIDGNALDGDGDGTAGGDYLFDFFFLTGDANHDGRVNLQDFNRLATNFGQSPRDFGEGDFNYDGVVNLQDFNRLAIKFGTQLGPDGQSESLDVDEREQLAERLSELR
jgi:extracellular elastinolytic metalloproteinase